MGRPSWVCMQAAAETSATTVEIGVCSDAPLEVQLFYRYVQLPDPEAVVTQLRCLCEELGLSGRMRIASEGINGILCGKPEQLARYREAMRQPGSPLEGLEVQYKLSAAGAPPPLTTAVSPPLHCRCTPPPPHYRNCCTVPACRCLTLAASPAASPWLPRHRRCTGEAVGAPCGPMAQAGAGRGLPRGTGAAHAPHADEADTAPLPLVCATLDLVVHGAGARDGPHPCRDHIETKPTTHGPRGQRRSSG